MGAHQLYLLIGGNQGDRLQLLQRATDLIGQQVGSVALLSPIYQTAPWGDFEEGMPPQPFLNQALEVVTELNAHQCLERTLAIEKTLGRERHILGSGLYSSRPIDIDLIFYDHQIVDAPQLTIPHPRMHLRRFVLVPLCDIAPEYIHPIFNTTLEQLLAQCPDTCSCSCYC